MALDWEAGLAVEGHLEDIEVGHRVVADKAVDRMEAVGHMAAEDTAVVAGRKVVADTAAGHLHTGVVGTAPCLLRVHSTPSENSLSSYVSSLNSNHKAWRRKCTSPPQGGKQRVLEAPGVRN